MVKSELIQIKARARSDEAGTQALADLKAGKTLDELAREWSSSVSDLGFIGRNQANIDAAVRNRAFSMSRPDQGKVYDGLSKASGEYVMLELSALVSNDAVADDNALESLAEGQANLEYQAILKLLTSRAEMTLFDDRDCARAAVVSKRSRVEDIRFGGARLPQVPDARIIGVPNVLRAVVRVRVVGFFRCIAVIDIEHRVRSP